MEIQLTIEETDRAIEKLEKIGTVEVSGTTGTFSAKGVEGNFSYDEPTEILTLFIDVKPPSLTQSYVEDRMFEFFVDYR